MDERSLRRILAEHPADAQAWCDLAQLGKISAQHDLTLAAYDRAYAIRPWDPVVSGLRRVAISYVVPRWHFPMLHDKPRNDAYAAAIRRAVSADHHVLEIGTGSGLLAMLAARSGARRVTTCEMVPIIATAARKVIAANGLADRIEVVTGKSQDLEIGRDISEAGDVLVSEIIGNDFLSEGVLAAVADARKRLLNSDAVIIPAAASIRIALAGGVQIERLLSAGVYDGLNLGAFDLFRPVSLSVPETFALAPLSEATDLFSFDFTHEARVAPDRRSVALTATSAGRCHGVVQWIRLQLDAATAFENTPFGLHRSHWEPMLHVFPRPLDVRAGDVVRVLAIHDVGSLMISLEAAPAR